MKTLKSLAAALAALVLLGVASPLHAQTIIDNTTFSAALTGTGTPQLPFETRVSLTAITCTGCTFGNQTIIFVDREAMQVTGAFVSGATNIPVTRGALGTIPSPHNTSATVFLGPPARFHTQAGGSLQGGDPPFGSCVRTAQLFLPWINLITGNVWSCDLSGKWIGTNSTALVYNSVQLR